MKIKRDKEKKEKTAEEKELDTYKKAKNTGLAAMGTGAFFLGTSRIGNNRARKAETEDMRKELTKHSKIAKISGLALGVGGGLLHGISAVKYNKLKNKLKKQQEEEKNDNPEKSKE